jgi:hypothetical protein
LLGRLNLAVMQKIYGKNNNPLQLVDPNHRYSQPKCTGIKLRTCAGEPDVDKICTSHIERLNLSVRTFNRRFTRPLRRMVTQAGKSSSFRRAIRGLSQLLQDSQHARLHASIRRKAHRP